MLCLTAVPSEVDSETGLLSEDIDKAQIYREETVDFVRSCLGLDLSKLKPDPHPNAIIESFRSIGNELRNGYSTRKLP